MEADVLFTSTLQWAPQLPVRWGQVILAEDCCRPAACIASLTTMSVAQLGPQPRNSHRLLGMHVYLQCIFMEALSLLPAEAFHAQ